MSSRQLFFIVLLSIVSSVAVPRGEDKIAPESAEILRTSAHLRYFQIWFFGDGHKPKEKMALLDVSDGKAKLIAESGKIVYIPLNRLKESDRNWINERFLWAKIILEQPSFRGDWFDRQEAFYSRQRDYYYGYFGMITKTFSSTTDEHFDTTPERIFTQYGEGRVYREKQKEGKDIVCHEYGPITLGLREGEKYFTHIKAHSSLFHLEIYNAARRVAHPGHSVKQHVWAQIVLDDQLSADKWHKFQERFEAKNKAYIVRHGRRGSVGLYFKNRGIKLTPQTLFSKYGKGIVSRKGREIFHEYGPIAFSIKPKEEHFSTYWVSIDLIRAGLLKKAKNVVAEKGNKG